MQGGLVDFQLQRIQQRLLAHRLHNAAGAQHRQTAFDPQVRVKSALSGLFAALDADDHRETAAVTGGLGFF